MAKTIIFDLGGVYFSDGTKNAIKIISEKYNISLKDVQNALKGDSGTKYRTGHITANEFWNEAKKLWNIDVPNEELSKIWLEAYKPIDGTENLVKRLKNSGNELLFLSDNVEERVKYLDEKYNFIRNFDDGVFSYLAKVRKPNPDIYKLILEKVHNKNSIYIDDNPELLKPAKELGIEVIAFKNAFQVENELRRMGVEF
jgi:HAD superfamily hydrolase (TIGR01509 family)